MTSCAFIAEGDRTANFIVPRRDPIDVREEESSS
jgi:hypothetical protein